MATTLPYHFDTRRVVTLILRGALGLLLVVVLAILYSLFVSHEIAATLYLLLVAAMVAYFCNLFRRNLSGSSGTITTDAVVVRPGQVWGLRLAGPAGTFSLSQFEAVRVERITDPIGFPIDAQIGPHERVSLVGKPGTPDILVVRTEQDAGRTMANELAAALKLPYQERIAPY